jgi:hypothetical protein
MHHPVRWASLRANGSMRGRKKSTKRSNAAAMANSRKSLALIYFGRSFNLGTSSKRKVGLGRFGSAGDGSGAIVSIAG